jgi:2-C-methyl-D-erythritol 4-phosphate cytidylyltransferase
MSAMANTAGGTGEAEGRSFADPYNRSMSSFPIGLAPRCFALVPAAGVGSRSGADRPKQYVPLAGRAMIAHTLAALGAVPRIEATLVVLSPDDDQFESAVPGFEGERGWIARTGGATRADTVAAGLQDLRERGAQPHDWVLVHDAARCLLRAEWVEALIAACDDDEVGGLLALPVADTLKDAALASPGTDPGASTSLRVAATVDRRGKWAAQTPQMFRLGLLMPALAGPLDGITDEASAIEALGHAPRLVEASMENFKVTYPADFALAERLLRSRA